MPDISKHFTKVLDVSISHITALDNDVLHDHVGDDDDFPVVVLDYRYGYLISAWHYSDSVDPYEIAEFEKNFLEEGFSKEFLALLKLAGEAGCLWLQLDHDGVPVPGLQEFSW